MIEIREATTDGDILATYEVMRQLRPHISREDYLPTIRRMQGNNAYHLAAALDQGRVVCVAGYRFGEMLAWGSYLYVDDLVTDESARSSHHGKRMIDWLVDLARRSGCARFHLDSGVQRHAAHRFYLRERLDISAFHFSRKL